MPRSNQSYAIRIAVAYALAACMWGCAGTRTGTGHYVRDGVEYGVTSGAFRGRWWNYYERGRSFLEGGYYPEAEKDLQSALAGRGQDQLWPRTYGLHFIPEYFPNRELGIVAYYQHDYQTARTLLERSLAQQHSARAAYYLNEILRTIVADGGGDDQPPIIEIHAPRPGDPIGSTELVVEGVISDNNYVRAITIAGVAFDVRVAAPEVVFQKSIVVSSGAAQIDVWAEDLFGNETTAAVPIALDLDGPVVSFDRPITFPGRLRGVVYDPSSVSQFRIAGRDVPLASGPTAHGFEFEVAGGVAEIDYECIDSLGNRTYGKLHPDAAILGVAAQPTVFSALGHHAPLATGEYVYVSAGGMVAAIATPDANEFSVNIENIVDGQEYYMDEIVAVIKIAGAHPLVDLRLNGEPIEVLPDRTQLRVSRRVQLGEGENTIAVVAIDTAGLRRADERVVRRMPSEVDSARARLALAFLGNLAPAHSAAWAGEIDYVLNELVRARAVQSRFVTVDRDLIDEVLAEQQLSEAMRSRQGKLALGRVIPADVMLAAWIRRDERSIEIVLDGASTQTARRVVSHVDVAGALEDVDQLIDDLGLRLAQEFPRVHGHIVAQRERAVTVDLRGSQGVRPDLNAVVYRTTDVFHPVTQELLGQRAEILTEGRIDRVGRDRSVLELPGDPGESGVAPIHEGDRVLVK